MKDIIIIGSTGSIGTQALAVVDKYPDRMRVVGMSCRNNIQLFNEQIAKYRPKYIAVTDKTARAELINNCGAKVLDSMTELVSVAEGDIVVTAVVGVAGLEPTMRAIECGKDIALANKETLVAGGDIVMRLAREKGVNIFPVDSEHSAIWQCSEYGRAKGIKKLILTASGGAFRGKTRHELEHVTAKDALKHPTWNMGKKVTVDSATLMNKGLEVIEAKHLFDINIDNIDVVIHKESIIHSMVTYNDNSIIAEMSHPDMTLPIQLALTYPDKLESDVPELDLAKLGSMHFDKPDEDTFRALAIARECARRGGIYPAIMNGANEIAVAEFLRGKIGFLDIAEYIDSTLEQFSYSPVTCLDDIFEADRQAREVIQRLIDRR